MLRSLSVRNLILIDRLDLTFDQGLCVLTGETGAGKSILLEALGLALGGRAEGRLLAPGPADDPMAYGMIDPLPFHPVFDYTYDGVMRSFEDSQQRLGLDRIDILLAHDIGEFQHGKEENDRHFADLKASGYRALAELRSAGNVLSLIHI